MFCSKCGFELHVSSSFCPQCGERLDSEVPVSVRLSMDDFLAMSTEYQEKKDEIKKRNDRAGLLIVGGSVFGALCLILSVVLLWLPLLVIGVAGAASFIVIWNKISHRLERELHDYGAQLYREYMIMQGAKK